MGGKLFFNPAVLVFPLDSGSNQDMVMCEVPARSETPLRYVLPAAVLDLLKLFDGSQETANVIAAYHRQYPGKYTAEKMEQLVNRFLVPQGLLIDSENPAPLPDRTSQRDSYLYLKVRLVSPRAVYLITRALRWLFRTPIFIAWLPVFVAAHFLFYLWAVPHYQFDFNTITGPEFLLIMLVTSVAGFAHELGHASALTFYGCRRAEVGWGLYLFFTVFYTDVSEAWRLNRTQRTMIDVAGVYFHSICLVLLLGLFWITESPMLLYCFFLIDIQIASSFNPFLRMDGYWLVTDLFGIFNLRKQSVDLLKFYLRKLFWLKPETKLPLWHLSRTARVTLCTYTVLGVAFFLYLYQIMFDQFVYHLIPGYPQILLTLWKSLHEDPVSVLGILSTFLEVLWRTVVLFGLVMFLYRVLLTPWRSIQRSLPTKAAKFLHRLNFKRWRGPELEGSTAEPMKPS